MSPIPGNVEYLLKIKGNLESVISEAVIMCNDGGQILINTQGASIIEKQEIAQIISDGLGVKLTAASDLEILRKDKSDDSIKVKYNSTQKTITLPNQLKISSACDILIDIPEGKITDEILNKFALKDKNGNGFTGSIMEGLSELNRLEIDTPILDDRASQTSAINSDDGLIAQTPNPTTRTSFWNKFAKLCGIGNNNVTRT